jgi:micrococcal nuclease
MAGAAAATLAVLGFLATDVFASASGAFTYTGRVVHVVDGDTLDVQVPGKGKVRVRVIGIDTPERGVCYFAQSTQRANALANGKEVVLHGDRTQATLDRYGRLLAYVDIGGKVDLGLQLIEGGFGKVYVYGGKPFLRVGPYRKAQQTAQSIQLGVWNCPVQREPIVVPSPIAAPITSTSEINHTNTVTPTAPTTTATSTATKLTTTTTTTTTAATTTAPPSTTTTRSTACDPSYPDFCIPPPPPDLDCADIPRTNFKVLPPDPHRFDGDKDGVGCEG